MEIHSIQMVEWMNFCYMTMCCGLLILRHQQPLFNKMVDTFSPVVVFLSFLLSETILGLVPPEIFIGWSAKSGTPWLFLFLLATMSYAGGILAYGIGKVLNGIPPVKNHIENKISLHNNSGLYTGTSEK